MERVRSLLLLGNVFVQEGCNGPLSGHGMRLAFVSVGERVIVVIEMRVVVAFVVVIMAAALVMFDAFCCPQLLRCVPITPYRGFCHASTGFWDHSRMMDPKSHRLLACLRQKTRLRDLDALKFVGFRLFAQKQRVE